MKSSDHPKHQSKYEIPPLPSKMLLQVWLVSAAKLVIGIEEFEYVDHLTYLEGLISSDGLVPNKISTRIQKARLGFTSSRHLWRR